MHRHSETTYAALSRNRWRTVWLLMLFPAMIVTVTYLACLAVSLYGATAETDAVVSSVNLFLAAAPAVTIGSTVWMIIALLGGKSMVLSFSGAKPINKSDAPELYRIVENLSIQTGIPMPQVYVIEDASMNAFATGYAPSQAAVAVTRGLLERLDRSELQAVMAHEIGHILHRDTRVMLIAITMVGILQLLAEIVLRGVFHNFGSIGGDRDRKSSGNAVIVIIVIAIVIWLISVLGALFVQMGISRRREFMADAESAHLTRHPQSLMSALQKISADPRVEVLDGKRTIAAMCIADPLERKQSFFEELQGLFSSHPAMHDRLEALSRLTG